MHPPWWVRSARLVATRCVAALSVDQVDTARGCACRACCVALVSASASSVCEYHTQALCQPIPATKSTLASPRFHCHAALNLPSIHTLTDACWDPGTLLRDRNVTGGFPPNLLAVCLSASKADASQVQHTKLARRKSSATSMHRGLPGQQAQIAPYNLTVATTKQFANQLKNNLPTALFSESRLDHGVAERYLVHWLPRRSCAVKAVV